MTKMTNKILLYLLTAAGLAAYPNGSRVPAGNAGEPGTGTPCGSCHGLTLNPSAGSVKLSLPGESTFTPGVAQRWTLTVADSNSSYRKGFQLTATAGTFKAVTSTVVSTAPSGRQYVNHSASASTYAFDWTPPLDADSVTVYFAGAAVSGTRQGDVYTSSLVLKKAGAKPAIDSGGVVNGATFAGGIASGSWVTIFGSNLAPAGVARAWRAEEIVDGKLPTTLEGTQVRINGKAAAIAYVSETQLNVQAPEDTSLGSVPVEISTSNGTGDTVTADLRAAAPGFFRFTPDSSRYAAAVHTTGVLAAPAGYFGSTIASAPAQPGETLLLYGTGFGPTDPEVPAGQTVSAAAPLAAGSNLSIRIGGIAANVRFAGLSAPGLYQFNVDVPELPDGDHLVEASVLGVSVPTQQYLAVKR